MRSTPSAIMQPWLGHHVDHAVGRPEETFTPNQKDAPLRQAQSGFEADCASSALSSLS
jgi:hypothetical protein